MNHFFDSILNLIDNIFEKKIEIKNQSFKKYTGKITIIEHSYGMSYLNTQSFTAVAPKIIDNKLEPFTL